MLPSYRGLMSRNACVSRAMTAACSGLLFVVTLASSSCATDLNIERGIVFAEPDGVRLKLDVYRPRDEGDALRPGMVLIHGGGWIAGTRRQQSWYCREFARNGYVVMSVGYRMMPKYHFPACLHDCKAAVRWMRLHADEYRIDPDRIVAFGASAGGHLAAFLAATEPGDGFEGTENPGPSSAVCAAVILYGAVDLTKYRDPPRRAFGRGAGRRYIRRFAGEEGVKKGADPFEYGSPITYAKAGMPAVFLAHGTKDYLVHYEQSEAFHSKLLDLGVPTQLYPVPKRNHGFDFVRWKERRTMFDAMLAFLEKHVAPRNTKQIGNRPGPQ